MNAGELMIVKKGLCVSFVVVLANLCFACFTAYLRTWHENQLPIKMVSMAIMAVAGYQFAVSMLSYVVR
eukprot:SAG11_NODE_7624_length_1119_cov_2.145098_1_plen_69_part_00